MLTWNLEWARPGSGREEAIRRILELAEADLICLTEAFSSTLPNDGVTIEAGPGNVVADKKCAKKVMLWSRWGWCDPKIGQNILPPGRFISGRTETPQGPLHVIGVCIPWRSSNMPGFGSGDCGPWEDHLRFIEGMKLELPPSARRTLIMGDFNQRLPRRRQPAHVSQALQTILRPFSIATWNFESRDGDQTIDHIAHSPDITVDQLVELPRFADGLMLSDHFGVAGNISFALTA